MRLPLLYAMSWPHRLKMPWDRLDFVKVHGMGAGGPGGSEALPSRSNLGYSTTHTRRFAFWLSGHGSREIIFFFSAPPPRSPVSRPGRPTHVPGAGQREVPLATGAPVVTPVGHHGLRMHFKFSTILFFVHATLQTIFSLTKLPVIEVVFSYTES